MNLKKYIPAFRWRYVVLIWLLIAVPLLWFHYAVGQTLLQKEAVRAYIEAAGISFRSGDFDTAEARLKSAAALLPDRQPALRAEVTLRTALVKLKQGELTHAADMIQETANRIPDVAPKLQTEIREALAEAYYYRAWFQRISGVSRQKWEPNAVLARQTYRWLHDNTPDASAYQRNLECAIRLTRMDLDALYEFPLPPELKSAKQKEKQSEKDGGEKPNGNDDSDQKGDKPKEGPGGKKKKPQNDIRDKENPEQQGGLGAPDLRGS